jgi:hypothetical protein
MTALSANNRQSEGSTEERLEVVPEEHPFIAGEVFLW